MFGVVDVYWLDDSCDSPVSEPGRAAPVTMLDHMLAELAVAPVPPPIVEPEHLEVLRACARAAWRCDSSVRRWLLSLSGSAL